MIVENNKGYSSAAADSNELLPLIELGFFKDAPLVCPAALLGDNIHTADNEL